MDLIRRYTQTCDQQSAGASPRRQHRTDYEHWNTGTPSSYTSWNTSPLKKRSWNRSQDFLNRRQWHYHRVRRPIFPSFLNDILRYYSFFDIMSILTVYFNRPILHLVLLILHSELCQTNLIWRVNNKHSWRDRNTKSNLLQISTQWFHRSTKRPNIQTSPLSQ